MKRPLVPSDLYAIVTLGDPQLSPDGRTVYVRRLQPDRAADAALATIWRYDADGRGIAFTSGRNDRLPRLSPDGTRLAFVADRDEKARIMLMPTSDGEAAPLGSGYEKIGALAWSPDGRRLAFTTVADHDPQTARIYHDAASGARHIRALPFKSDLDGLLDGRRMHLHVLDVERGSVERITRGDFDVAAPAWSPDSTQIAFAAAIGWPEYSFGSDIHVVDVAGGAVRTLTAHNGPMGTPSWSHDGRTIALTGHQNGDDAGGRFNTELLLVDAAGGSVRSLSSALDRSVGDSIIGDMRSGFGVTPPVWRDGDREIIVQVSDEGACGLRAFAVDGGAVRVVAGGPRDISAFAAAGDAVAFVFSTPTIPSDLARIGADGGETRLTAINDAFLAERIVVAPQRYRPVSDDGVRLDAWLLETPEPPQPPPLVLQVHGGPHAAYGHSFFFEFQLLAGAGMSVAYGNPRGGQSYGHAYADAIRGDWGGIDAADVLCILDGALAATTVDSGRIGLAGGSYGGFMTTWLLGHSDRFAAGVSMRAVNDFVSEVGASDIGWFLERELAAPSAMSDRGRVLFENSPMRAAPQIDVPLLVEHSERDYRCPIDQAEQLFTLLRRLDKKYVEFVRFTGDGHELSRGGKPRNRILRLRAIAHWFIRHLRPAGVMAVAEKAGSLFAPLAGEDDGVPVAAPDMAVAEPQRDLVPAVR